ncbi:outer membrane beta-barrel protein [Aridibaculum aurantiacum]|uniref:outer membrane beta-barrel protein n=1 Tax=Aridibaculum aurantiacum TaxID=2810307 RepID=UPI001A95D0F0|nr:outer membrane beta-barrel protein [Aridibaculum aurantiacum]
MKNGMQHKIGLLLAMCLALFTIGNAQEVSVKGRLVDSASTKQIADATINFQEVEKKISKTILSDKSGAFQTNLVPGRYRVMITHSSFRRRLMPLKVEAEPIDIGNVQLVPGMKMLGDVTVTAARPMVEQQGDKLIYNVEDDPVARSESASDILRRTPYVNVDGDGAIQVNGQSNFRVLLDGRETALFSQNVKEALKAFPGATIARIEIITSPSAKYDAEGVGGIINIITKKKVAGYNGTINSGINSLGNTNAGLNINLKVGKVGISGTYSVMNNDGLRSRQMGITTPVNPIAFASRQVGGGRVTDLFFHQGNLELSYDIDSTNTLVFYGNMGKHRNRAENDYTINTLFANGNSDISPYLLDTRFEMPTYGFGSDYIRKFKGKPQKEFNIRFNALYNTNRSFSNSQQDIGPTDRFLLNNSEAFNSEYTVQADLIEPINKSTRLETGVKTILRKAYSDFESLIKFNKAEPYRTNPANTDRFGYDQNVYGGYVSVNKVTKVVTARLGLRIEHTSVFGDFTSTSTTVRQEYTNLIPNVMLSRQFSKTMNSNFTYNMRLGRPFIQSLNPFVNNNDSLNISFGNPNLGPQYVHSFALQNRFFKGPKFISIQTGFNFANNLIIQNPTYDPSTGVTSVTGANAGQIREFSLGFVSNLPVGKWNFAVNATGRLARIRNSLQTSFFTTTAGNMNANITYKASPVFTIASNSGYGVPLRMPNSTFPDNYFYGFSFIYKVLKGKLTMTANINNFLEEERKLFFVTETANFTTTNTNHILFRNFGLALNYSFGKLKENVSKKKGVNNDDAVQ